MTSRILEAPQCPMALVHHDPARYEIYEALAPVHHDGELDRLCIFDAELIAAIFRSDALHVASHRDFYRQIMERTGIDMRAIIHALDHVPLANEGETHKRLRNGMASAVAGRSAEIRSAVGAWFEEVIATKFRPGSRVDLVEEVFGPVYERLFSIFLGVDHARIDANPEISRVFDRAMSLNRRKKLNASIESLATAFRERKEQLATEPELAVAMNVLGHDALIGSFSLALWHLIEANAGTPLGAIPFPAQLPATSIPYLERVAVEDTTIAGVPFKKGQVVWLFVDAVSGRATGDAEDPDLLFGRGRHLCLGKPSSQIVWRELTTALSRCDLPARAASIEIRPNDYVFHFPLHAWIEIDDR